MSTLIKFDLKELKKLVNDKNSCVLEKRVKQKLALQPRCLGNLKESIKELLDYRIGKYDKEHEGILLSYSNVRVLQNVGAIRNDNADVHFEVQIDLYIFAPFVGAKLKGIVSKKCATHLAVVIHRVFNVVIPRPTDEPGTKWEGSFVKEGQEILLHVVVLDMFGALPYIRGELDENYLEDGEGDDVHHNVHIEPSLVNLDKTKPYNIKKNMGDMQDGVSKMDKKELMVIGSSLSDRSSPSRESGSKTKSKRKSKITHNELSGISTKSLKRN